MTLRHGRLRRARRGYGATAGRVPLDRADELARRTAGPLDQVRAALDEDAVEVVASEATACLPYLDLARARVAQAQEADPEPYLRRAARQARQMGLPTLQRLLEHSPPPVPEA